jgi:hypothetical protein
MTRVTVLLIMAFLYCSAVELPGAMAETSRQAEAIPAEDYTLYDQVVTSKFLTSATQLIIIERMTSFRFSPNQEGPTTIEVFQEKEYFEGELPADLIREFVFVNRQPSRLERQFHVGVAYRFTTGNHIEEPEVSLPPYDWGQAPVLFARGIGGQAPTKTSEPVPSAATQIQAPLVLDRLAFSRVARNRSHDQALLSVETLRPDGTGAGFLLWCRRQGQRWAVFDTEVIWTIQAQEETEEGPLLAP